MIYKNFDSNIGLGFLGLAYNLGADYETPENYGTAHLMEHMICKSYDHMRSTLTRLGVDNNAYTSNDRVVFWFKGLNESLKDVGQELYDSITQGQYVATREAFEIEKAVVLQEYGDSFNSQTGAVILNKIRQHYNFFCAIGERSCIERFTYEDYKMAISKFKNQYILCEVGDSYVNFEKTKNVTLQKPTPQFGVYNTPIEKCPKLDKTLVGLISKIPVANNILWNKLNLIDTCLNGDLEAPLYHLIREIKGLSYGSYGWGEQIYDQNILTYCAVTTNERANELKDVYNSFFNGDVLRHITKQRFNDCYQELLIKRKKSLLLPHNHASNYAFCADPYEGLSDFSYDDIAQLTQDFFKLENFEMFEY